MEILKKIEEYKKLSDEEIIGIAENGDQEALEFLLNKYKYLVKKQARTLYLIGADREDLVQEGMIGLYKAIRTYEAKKTGSFAYYAGICINSHMCNAVKSNNRKKNIPLNSYISFSSDAFENEESGDNSLSIGEMISSEDMNPEKLLIDREVADNFRFRILKELSKYETDVFNLFTAGRSYEDISNILGKPVKSVDNAVQRIRNKTLKILEERK